MEPGSSAHKAENDGADEEESNSDNDIVHEELPFGTAGTSAVGRIERSVSGTAIEFQVAHRHRPFLGGRYSTILKRLIMPP